MQAAEDTDQVLNVGIPVGAIVDSPREDLDKSFLEEGEIDFSTRNLEGVQGWCYL